MSRANRPNRKVNDELIIAYNSLGVSLASIAKELGCHPSSVTLRLQKLGIAPTDTRRAFCEELLSQLKEDQIEWIAAQLSPTYSIKSFITDLVKEAYKTGNKV